MKTDGELQREIQHQLQCDPRVDEQGVGVNVHKGAVTLVGTVPHYAERRIVAEIVASIDGVVAMANELDVGVAAASDCRDIEIAEAAAAALRAQADLPDNKVKAMVYRGWVTLTGEVRTQSQRTLAERVVTGLGGVKGVVNSTTVKTAWHDETQEEIAKALRLRAALEAQHIAVEFKSGAVSLRGCVQSEQQRNDAALLAWTVPGVSKVENRIVVHPETRHAY